ncbi:MAG TPA: hypothetical protein DEB73_03235 [Candidatus Magasanikbacteria bacterium]|uniref:Uncharacterized protein n=1 Tax=Candidatus Magasanikbacteria bacterium GW2011_GWA2_42_32 TaxID=1619039 RepID=A0A0G0ZZ81_9BACT|nr:MAG: hypothetical protein UV20_C0043G0009 [Candidatus Magasanikbacteria bacterium GW2011_GWA2_42_32]HBV58244.1 hypothetical protein [Candidatus Magasanikbacteria bacterium]HBX16039.1 hypothetical protein [Candidatus Magasanikbacteria bacterium]
MASQSYHMVVEKIILNGRHGPYAVASSKDLGCVTFSLDREVWQESDHPEPGMFVVLSQIRKKRAGWRAQSGRFLKPSDEQQQATEERA